jgi:hypothetical protein
MRDDQEVKIYELSIFVPPCLPDQKGWIINASETLGQRTCVERANGWLLVFLIQVYRRVVMSILIGEVERISRK